MDSNELHIATDKLVLKSVSIYGCDLPQTDLLADEIAGEIIEFIMEFEYGDLTLAEIILSFRLNQEGVELKYESGDTIEPHKFSRGYINTNFLSCILKRYWTLRRILDRKFENVIMGYETF